MGQLIVRRLVAALKLDEARLAALLSGSTEGGGPLQAALVAQLLGCYGNLLSASLDMGWPPSAADGDVADDGGPAGPRFMLKLANNEASHLRII